MKAGTVKMSEVRRKGSLLARDHLGPEHEVRGPAIRETVERLADEALAKESDMREKTTKTAAKRSKARGAVKGGTAKVDRSPLAVGTFICRDGGATPKQLEARFKTGMHPLRAKIYDARHKLGFKIDYDAKEGRYSGTEPRFKAAVKGA